ncbi:MAG: hypothetical protein GKR94_18465 [Gammaproteobacteria bacterium]|nr:hypothetical protein [Gammaproteobacteria bacterium]
MDDEALFEALARAAGLDKALADHRREVLAAARSAMGYQSRREIIADRAAEPAHVFRAAHGDEQAR